MAAATFAPRRRKLPPTTINRWHDRRLGQRLSLSSNAFRPTDLPDVLIFRIRVKSSHQKYFAFTEARIRCMSAPSCSLQEGRIAIVTTRGCGMRWTRRHGWTSDAGRDGEIAWSWRPDAGVNPRVKSPGRRRLTSPALRGERV
jgi:hypothetical protein